MVGVVVNATAEAAAARAPGEAAAGTAAEAAPRAAGVAPEAAAAAVEAHKADDAPGCRPGYDMTQVSSLTESTTATLACSRTVCTESGRRTP